VREATLAPRPAPVVQRPRAGAPIATRGAPDVSGRAARAKHPRGREHRIPPGFHGAPQCNHAACNTAHRPQGKNSPTDKAAFFLVTGAPSRSWHLATRAAPNWCAAPHATAVAVLCCCTRGPGFRIMSLTCGAKGTRTPGLLHAISRQHVHRSTSVEVTVSGRALPSSGIQAGCCTFVLYSRGTSMSIHICCGTSLRTNQGLHPPRFAVATIRC
jgi:hypothetical protein